MGEEEGGGEGADRGGGEEEGIERVGRRVGEEEVMGEEEVRRRR